MKTRDLGMGRSLVWLLGVSAAVVLVSGCKTDDSDQSVDRTDMLSSNDRVSSVPWNKPQGWENKSQLGALAQDPRIGGQQ